LSIEPHHAPSRADRRARLQTTSFNLAWHLGTFGAVCMGALVVGAWWARSARLSDLWIVPAYLLVANVSEYLIHRLLMHRPLWPRTFYRGHTLGHHRAFHHDSMDIGPWHELELVMMPWFSIVAFFTGLTPVIALVVWAFGRGAAGLLLLAAVVSFVAYEGMHVLYHLPPSVLRRRGLLDSRVFRSLYDHHRHHHRLVRMRWVNFNISMPLSDRWFGSLESEGAWQRGRDERRPVNAVPGEAPDPAGDDDKHAA
jgi:hypothetical protein